MTNRHSVRFLLAASVAAFVASSASAQEAPAFRIGIVTFLSGAAAGPFGIPAKNAADLFAEAANKGALPAPYAAKGFGGRAIELVTIDEAGGATKQVSEFQNLVEQQKVDAVVGYISSGDCVAVAPAAEQMKKLLLLFDCGTPRIFEEGSYKYVFRPVGHAAMDNVAAAIYVNATNKDFKKYAGINQNYAWGQDSWNDFEATLKAIRPQAVVVSSQMPKLGAGQYNAEISAILAAEPEVLHSSFWGGDLEGLVLQGAPRNLFKTMNVVLTAGETATHRQAQQIPDGTIIGARGPNAIFAPENAYNTWLRAAYSAKFNALPSYPSYHMVQSLLALKFAYEKAKGGDTNKAPTTDEIAGALRGTTFEGPSGTVKMSLGGGQQAIQGTAYGRTKLVDGKTTVVDVRRFAAEEVNPPDGVKTSEWIKTLKVK
ncbi:ABC transporter substrate-binding protein [Bradyrhizobium sp.]|jgi:branched-chain amino acid transport system substrate-binding protein|uniref:ABC transporter substrate-binding protein n=1 Tax=Bradyrhizobium sp. TaxID=376 RepID=UPI001DCD3CC8|nr:ABC transporter substrate-binding protein [Bradyrhizobium sp.]MBI5317830.1 ABC transporter substrate-binding protein [Bradyrhizobium sp.]